MKIIVYWKKENTKELMNILNLCLEELGLNDFIELENSESSDYKKEFWIKAEPALIIEEESIEFKDMIFEWQTPSQEEIKSMLVSIIWGWSSSWWCAPGWCGSWCSC